MLLQQPGGVFRNFFNASSLYGFIFEDLEKALPLAVASAESENGN